MLTAKQAADKAAFDEAFAICDRLNSYVDITAGSLVLISMVGKLHDTFLRTTKDLKEIPNSMLVGKFALEKAQLAEAVYNHKFDTPLTKDSVSYKTMAADPTSKLCK